MKKKLRKFWRKIKSIIRMKGSPYAIAMGTAIGLFLNFIPSFGIGFLISAAIARLFKASAIAALTMNLGTGFFIPLFYSLNILTGRFLLHREITPEKVGDTVQQSLQESLEVVEEIAVEPVKYFYLDKLQSFSADFFLGGVVNAFLASGLIYLIFWSLLTYRRHRREAHKKTESK
jgi:uncharacterized protein (DUF2062 family)